MNNTVVLYHANCMDGFASAWVHRHLVGDEKVQYIPMDYNKELPTLQDNEIVFMLDYSIKRDELIALCSKVAYVTIIDHHKSAVEDLQGLTLPNLIMVLDAEHSGCVLTWEYFAMDTSMPLFLWLIEDRDMWWFKKAHTRAFHAKASIMAKEFDVWDDYLEEENVFELINMGNSILDYHNSLVKEISNSAYLNVIDGTIAMYCQCPYSLISDVGDYLLTKYALLEVVVLFVVFDSQVKYSIRGKGNVDVSAIAAKHGGGGHHNAAGFTKLIEESHMFSGDLK